jgi:GDP/UDP-N,N'-diacetylbacillosamine 2-epimerase (hydrolysing)
LDRAALEKSLEFSLGKKSLLVTFHPATLETLPAVDQMAELLASLDKMQDTQLVFTLPNADTQGRALIQMVTKFVERHSNARLFASLGQLRYLSCIAQVDGVVGNSSSGLAEVPSFKKGTINIGYRQRGRLQASSVISCAADRGEISAALQKLYSIEFQMRLGLAHNPYGEGGASEKVLKILKEYPIRDLAKKSFHDL